MSWFNFGKQEVKSQAPSGYLEKCLKRIEEAGKIERIHSPRSTIFKVPCFAVSKISSYFKGVHLPLTYSEQTIVYNAIFNKYQIQKKHEDGNILKDF